ncbi:MAG: hypothetical protein COV44_09175 [Deltaproteobacteria bacterium CG11_big_fil_rev_8_21_14_0_20_45_16]|nr:MAG: hypothetical protein COV44_09175 [Deltaproteobacteria bacterium CG11_big_fil_rev_8_21_14_0_20_45_16]
MKRILFSLSLILCYGLFMMPVGAKSDHSNDDHSSGGQNNNRNSSNSSHDEDDDNSAHVGSGANDNDDNSIDADDNGANTHADHGSSDNVRLCHVPPGNPAAAHTINVGASAVNTHLTQHAGDALGDCVSSADNCADCAYTAADHESGGCAITLECGIRIK